MEANYLLQPLELLFESDPSTMFCDVLIFQGTVEVGVQEKALPRHSPMSGGDHLGPQAYRPLNSLGLEDEFECLLGII